MKDTHPCPKLGIVFFVLFQALSVPHCEGNASPGKKNKTRQVRDISSLVSRPRIPKATTPELEEGILRPRSFRLGDAIHSQACRYDPYFKMVREPSS